MYTDRNTLVQSVSSKRHHSAQRTVVSLGIETAECAHYLGSTAMVSFGHCIYESIIGYSAYFCLKRWDQRCLFDSCSSLGYNPTQRVKDAPEDRLNNCDMSTVPYMGRHKLPRRRHPMKLIATRVSIMLRRLRPRTYAKQRADAPGSSCTASQANLLLSSGYVTSLPTRRCAIRCSWNSVPRLRSRIVASGQRAHTRVG